MGKKGSNKSKKIIKFSAKLMRKNGYKGASLQQVADHVGIHKSTLFHYFKNKEELLLAVLRVPIEDLIEELKMIITNKDLPPEEKLKKAISTHVVLLTSNIDSANVYHSAMMHLTSKNKKEYLETRKYYGKCFQQIIDEVKIADEATFKDLDSKLVSSAILGMINWMAKWYNKNGKLDIDTISDQFYRLIAQKNLGA